MTKKSKSKGKAFRLRGRKRKEGERYANGRLKPEPKTPSVAAERRKELCDDPTKASCPLDAALANGWISQADHSAAMAYVNAYRASKMQAPGCKTAADLSAPSSAIDVRGIRYADMPSEDIAAVWDSVASQTRRGEWGLVPDDTAEAAALERWRWMNNGMSPAARSELQLVAIYESWPQWINQLNVVRVIEARAKAEKRQLTKEEEIKIAKCEASPFMRKKALLHEACAHVRLAMSPAKIESAPVREGEIIPVPGPKVAETIHYVDPMGAPVLEVVRVRRKR